MEQLSNPEISPQSPPLSEPMPAQVIEYYSNQNSALVLVQKIVRITGLLAILAPIAWLLTMFTINDHFSKDMGTLSIGKVLCLSSALADIPMIILGILMMLKYDHSKSLFILSWITLILFWASFGYLIWDIKNIITGIQNYCYFGSLVLVFSTAFFTLNGLLGTLQSIPEYKSYMR